MATKAFIIGISSFAGPFLAQNLVRHGFEVSGTDRLGNGPPDESLASLPVFPCDICDAPAVRGVLARVLPDRVYLLAAQSSAQDSFRTAVETFETNALGAVNVLAACRDLCPRARVLLVSSGSLYDPAPPDPVTEDSACRLSNPYALSKAAGEQYARLAGKTGGLPHTVIVRPFNHTGPGQTTRFVVPALAEQVSRLKRCPAPGAAVKTGDLSAYRDFTDVRDVVEAYRLALEHGRAFQTYNIASGATHRISDLLDLLLALAGVSGTPVFSAPGRPEAESSRPFAVDTRSLRALCGWHPRIPIEKTLRDILDWFETGRRDL